MPGSPRWPLHPQPGEWEGLEPWVRRLAAAYNVRYDIFLREALQRHGRGARDLAKITDEQLERLSVGTGVPVKRLREITGWQMTTHLWERGLTWLQSPEGEAAVKATYPALRHLLQRVDRKSDS